MAFKGFSMISPSMTREVLMPVYHHWGELVRNAGCPLHGIDSDGFVGELIPIGMKSGINVCDPMEVATLNDIMELRRRFNTRMAFLGAVDKRAIVKRGKRTLRRKLRGSLP
jgi:hypothetical protein